MAGAVADVAGAVHHPCLIGEIAAVRDRINIAPGGAANHDIRPGAAAVTADLHGFVGTQQTVGAGHDQGVVAGGEVAQRAGVSGNGGDRHRRCRRCGVHDQGGIGIAHRTAGIRVIPLRILEGRAIQIECGDCQISAVCPASTV